MSQTTAAPETLGAAQKDEIEGVNEILLKLLSTYNNISTPARPIVARRARTLSGPTIGNSGEGGHLSDAGHPIMIQYPFMPHHHGSPMNSKNPPNWLPPIGVFWDIENCQVPKGRSASALAQVIRDKFFHGYREAEFIVVCDIQKENKIVVQELNDAQVNLIHVASTYKNAADEKLKQSIRRFADIHGSPACIILISSDINFAADLSDIRHRKKIHVILLHNDNSSEALILCANEHFHFSKLMESLPIRTPSKVSDYCDLLVTNLPKDKDSACIKRRLKRLSDNCGGKVIAITSNVATIRFNSQDTADRAKKRMDGENVFDAKIIVRVLKEKEKERDKENRVSKPQESSILAKDKVEKTANSPIQMYSVGSAISGARSLPGTPHYHSSSPVVGVNTGWNGIHCAPMNPPAGLMPPPPAFVGRSYNTNGDVIYNRSFADASRVPPPVSWQVGGIQQQYGRWDESAQVERHNSFGKRIQVPLVRDNGISNSSGGSLRTPDGFRRIRGSHGAINHSQEWSMQRPASCNLPGPPNFNGNSYRQSNNFKRRSPSPLNVSQNVRAHVVQWNGHPMQLRNSRTPSPFENSTMHQIAQHPPGRTSPYQHSEPENEEIENFFNPINISNSSGRDSANCIPIELQVTNLDQNMEPKEIKRVLSSIFMEHVMVLHVSVFKQSDGNFAASVKVPSLPDAQYAISQLHRRKVGYKRILISYAHTGGPNPQLVRSQIVMLLQEVPGHKLPLFNFRSMYESRFMISISVSELHKMKDVCIINDDPDGRMISLNPDHRNTPSPGFGNMSQDGHLEFPYCTIHTQKPWPNKGWAEQELASLPNVKISLKVLGTRIHRLLTTHNGGFPLPSLPNCYEEEFKEPLEVDDSGVPLEHLVSCLPSIDLRQGIGSVKYVIWNANKPPDDSHEEAKGLSPSLINQLTLFSRELVDLLKTAPHCQLPFNRFIPAYHHHFGRQCRVADYGFTKLIDLLESLTHTVQVMGEGNKRMVTLSHRAQVRRFTSDLLRVLKAQASKQITLSEFPTIFSRVLSKPWDVVDYGVCEITDILNEVSENTVVVTNFNANDKLIAIPKREQTPDEIERTKQFSIEVVELLRHAPQCSMLFNKFVPSYHHHFNHQCRVSDYGFTKLIELFEAIPHVVKIEDTNCGDRRISLTEKEGLRVLGEQIAKLVARSRGGLSVSSVGQAFLQTFGYFLRPEAFQCTSIPQLLEKLTNTVKVIHMTTGPIVILVDKSHLQQLGLQCRRILMDQPQQKLSVEQFQSWYNQFYGSPCDIGELQQDLSHVVSFSGEGEEQFVELTLLQRFACELYRVMMQHGGKMNVWQFEAGYAEVIGRELNVAEYGYHTLLALIQALPCTVVMQESRNKQKQKMFLNKKLAAVGIALPSSLSSPYRDRDSSNDSVESEQSMGALTLEERDKWKDQLKACQNAWAQSNEATQTSWPKNCDSRWAELGGKADELSNKWPEETSAASFLRGLSRTPGLPKTSLPDPGKKEISPPMDESGGETQWRSSVWVTPPQYNYPQDCQTNVVVPPFIIHKIDQDDCASSLLSPAKNLLPATANPLNPRISPYFSAKRSMVVAPHPSELPLPSLNLAQKRGGAKGGEESLVIKEKLANSLEDTSTTDSENYNSNSENESIDRVSTTPNKRSVLAGKRRLAAQFNQPLDQ